MAFIHELDQAACYNLNRESYELVVLTLNIHIHFRSSAAPLRNSYAISFLKLLSLFVPIDWLNRFLSDETFKVLRV